MKKIFITIPWFVPAFRAGGPVQSVANLVKEYTDDVHYFIFCGDTDLNGAELENVRKNEWVGYNEITEVWYASPDKVSDTLVKLVEQQQPDILLIIGMFSWHFNIVPIVFCKGPRKILSTRGMLHPGALSQKKWKKKAYLQLFKMMEYDYKVDFHATDEAEANYIRGYFGGHARVFVAGNFANKMPLLPLPAKTKGSIKLVSISVISPMKNILLVLQALQQSEEQVQYDIYGPVKDEEYLDRCRELIKSIPENVKIEFHKEVEPAHVREVLQAAHVFILPSKSENFGHAMFEALSAGRPLVTGNHTPWNHLLESKAGMNVSVSDAVDIQNAIHFFSQMEAEELERWSKNAAAYAESKVDAAKTREEYRRMFE